MVLVACEESQRTTAAFRALGYEAYSCDIKPTSGHHPEWHIQDDVFNILNDPRWELLIAHPPCTFLSKVTAPIFNDYRYREGLKAAQFFMDLYECKIPYRCIENPVPLKCFDLPRYTQIVSPHFFGSQYSKMTALWLVNMFCLQPTHFVANPVPFMQADWSQRPGADRQAARSKTDPFLATAFAEQFSIYLSDKP